MNEVWKDIPQWAVGEVTINDEDFEIELFYTTSGYYSPGKISGPPENCYPPEGDEEREITDIRLDGKSISRSALSYYLTDEAVEQLLWSRDYVPEGDL